MLPESSLEPVERGCSGGGRPDAEQRERTLEWLRHGGVPAAGGGARHQRAAAADQAKLRERVTAARSTIWGPMLRRTYRRRSHPQLGAGPQREDCELCAPEEPCPSHVQPGAPPKTRHFP